MSSLDQNGLTQCYFGRTPETSWEHLHKTKARDASLSEAFARMPWITLLVLAVIWGLILGLVMALEGSNSAKGAFFFGLLAGGWFLLASSVSKSEDEKQRTKRVLQI